MRFNDTGFPGLYLIELDPVRDERGYFARTFCVDTFDERGLESRYLQGGTSFNAKSGTVRGMHFQKPPHGEVKLIRCTRGAIHDVVIDIRPGSTTYLKHYDVELAEGDGRELYVPDGFAHGFQTSAGCERSPLHAVDPLRAGGGERVSLGRSSIRAVLADAYYGDFRPRPELAVARWKNEPMKLVVFGAYGQAGSSLRPLAEKRGLVIDAPRRAALDVRNTPDVTQYIKSASADWVVNFTAFHVLEACEDDFAEAMLVNAVAVQAMAAASRAAGAKFLSVSTDYVFDGRQSRAVARGR